MRIPFLAAALLSLVGCEAQTDSKPTVQVEIIPHTSQRYNTVGDYWIDSQGVRQIRISDLGNRNYEFLILTHELVEIELNRNTGVTDQMVDDFDFAFERNRRAGDESEPGDDPRAPYYAAHQFATEMERKLAQQLGVDWDAYDARILEVSATYPPEQ